MRRALYEFVAASLVFFRTDGPEQSSSASQEEAFVENPQHRLQWIAYLEFTHNDEVGDLTWDKVCFLLPLI